MPIQRFEPSDIGKVFQLVDAGWSWEGCNLLLDAIEEDPLCYCFIAFSLKGGAPSAIDDVYVYASDNKKFAGIQGVPPAVLQEVRREIERIREDRLHPALKAGRDQIPPALQDGPEDSLRKLFEARTKIWKYCEIDLECAGIGLFDDFILALKPPRAAKLLGAAFQIAMEQEDPDLLETALYLLSGIAETAGSAIIASGSTKQLKVLEDKLKTSAGSQRARAGHAFWLERIRGSVLH